MDPHATHKLAEDDKLWVLAAHLSWLIGFGIVAPLVIWVVHRDKLPEKQFLVESSVEALNFQITAFAASLVLGISGLFICIPHLFLPVVAIASIVFSIQAAIKASEGKHYRYPLTVRLITA